MMTNLVYIGHAAVLVEMDGVRVLTDPILRTRAGPLRRHGPPIDPAWCQQIDAVVISHVHQDHLDLPSLRLLEKAGLRKGIRLIVPPGAATFLRRAGFRNVEELEIGDTVRIEALEIEATYAEHKGFRPPFGPTADCTGYIISGSRRVYFAGDTDLFPGMRALAARRLDAALLPIWGWGPSIGAGHLDPRRAAEALTLLRPRMVVPIHWGCLQPLGMRPFLVRSREEPPRDFVRYASEVAPDVAVHILGPGQALGL